MLPDNTLIELEEGTFLSPRDKRQTNITTWEMGGVALLDASEGYTYPWYSHTNGNNIYIQREGAERHKILHSVEDITEMNFTFDQNMRPTVAYMADGIGHLYWYDSTVAENVTTTYTGMTCPRLSLDDKRKFNVANSDIIFAYIKDSNKLCYRLQRERYGVEHELMTKEEATPLKPLKLYRIGLSTANRFMFETN